jgi:hypothetical protein
MTTGRQPHVLSSPGPSERHLIGAIGTNRHKLGRVFVRRRPAYQPPQSGACENRRRQHDSTMGGSCRRYLISLAFGSGPPAARYALDGPTFSVSCRWGACPPQEMNKSGLAWSHGVTAVNGVCGSGMHMPSFTNEPRWSRLRSPRGRSKWANAKYGHKSIAVTQHPS